MRCVVGFVVLVSILTLGGCGSSATAEGEGEGGEGEGEGEGEGGEGEGEGEGEAPSAVLGSRLEPTVVDFPFVGVIEATAGAEQCVQVVVNAGASARITASTTSDACTDGNEDTVVLVYDQAGNFLTENDDGGEGLCSTLSVVLGAGTYAVCARPLGDSDIGPTVFSVSVENVQIIPIGGACEPTDVCDPSRGDQNNDGIGDRVACIAGVCTVVVTVEEGEACIPGDVTQVCDDVDFGLECASTAPGNFVCIIPTFLAPGDRCDPDVTAVRCRGGLSCNEGVCEPAFTAACEDALVVTSATVEVSYEDTSSLGDDACSATPAQLVVAYEPTTTPSLLRFTSNDSVVGVRARCSDPVAECTFPSAGAAELANVSGLPVFVFMTPNEIEGQTQGSFSVEEVPMEQLSEGDACDWLSITSTCIDEGNRCSEGVCAVPTLLSVDEATAVTAGINQHCFRVEEPGDYEARTSGACDGDDFATITLLDVYEGFAKTQNVYPGLQGADVCTVAYFSVGAEPIDVCVTPWIDDTPMPEGTLLTVSVAPDAP
jgi:hypothetical protein